MAQLMEVVRDGYRFLIEEGIDLEFTTVSVSRLDGGDVRERDIEKIRLILNEKLDPKRYSLQGFKPDLFRGSIRIFVNFTKEERVRRGAIRVRGL